MKIFDLNYIIKKQIGGSDILVLKKEIDNIKEKGYAIETEEYEYGLSSVAVPIFNHENELLGAIGIAGLSARLSPETLHEFAQGILKINAKNIRI